MTPLTSTQRLLLALLWLALLLGAGWLLGQHRAAREPACGAGTSRRRGLDHTLAACLT